MKIFITTIILASAAFSQQLTHTPADRDLVRTKECEDKTGVNPELVTDFNEGTISDDDKLKCYFKCRFVASNRMSENGQFSPTAFNTTVPTYVDLSNADEIVAKCKDLKGTDPCDDAFVVAKCMREESMS